MDLPPNIPQPDPPPPPAFEFTHQKKPASKRGLLILVLLLLVLVPVGTIAVMNQTRFIPRAADTLPPLPAARNVLLLIYNPIIESQGSKKLTEVTGWYDPDTITNTLLSQFPTVSHGNLTYQITERQEIDTIPVKADGFAYDDASYLACLSDKTTCHMPDGVNYQKIFTDYDVCNKNFDEVWLWGGPYFGYWEYHPANFCGKTTFVMGFSYERGEGEAFHNFGHRMEYVAIRRVGGGTDSSWQQNEVNEWNKFSLINGHCGNIHWPPGTAGGAEYIYNKPEPVQTDCDGYLNYPDGPFTPQPVTCSAWSCEQSGYVQWWLSHIPASSGTSVSPTNGKTIYNNWWRYFVYFDETAAPLPTATPDPNTTPTVTPTSAPAGFSNLSGSFNYPTPATFSFVYGGATTQFTIDVSTLPDMSFDVYLSFAQGTNSPIVLSNPTKWDKYSCGRTLYWRVKTSTGVQSAIQASTVICPTATPTNSPTPTNTPTPTPTPTSTPNPTPSPEPTASSTPTNTPTPIICNIADINDDGQVGILDYDMLIAQYFNKGTNSADLNGDGIVDLTDYSILVFNWSKATGPCQ